MKRKVIGIFDSGIGGKSIQKEVKKVLPKVKTIYLKDTKNFPYGQKTPERIKKISEVNTKRLLAKGADLILVACNTATVNAISFLRKKFPKVSFVGVEPAIKPAGELSKKGIIILSSPKTTKSRELAILIEKYAKGRKFFNVGSLELVEAIEKKYSALKINQILSQVLPKEILTKSDVLVLGCTHFPLVKNVIQKYVGKEIKIIDSGKAVAKRVKEILNLGKKEKSTHKN